MNTTLTILCLVLVLYLATCIRQWRRLSHEDDGEKDHPHPTGLQQ